MAYKIYEMVKPEVLKKTEPDGYHIKTTELITLKEAECSGLGYSYDSELSAKIDIEQNREDLKHKDLVVLEVISVDWQGETN